MNVIWAVDGNTIYKKLSMMWTVDGNIQEVECDVDSGWKYTGGLVCCGEWMEIYRRLSMMWTVDGNIEEV